MIAMDISGFDVANIRITVENETLCIRGERTNKIGDTFVMDECFALDKEQFDEDSVHAKASDGVLEVKVQKKTAPRPRVISILTGDKMN
jgi:HSP20 family molecular chaperone IbpA